MPNQREFPPVTRPRQKADPVSVFYLPFARLCLPFPGRMRIRHHS